MGRLIPKSNPKYDHTLDLDCTVAAPLAELTDALLEGVNRKNVEIEEQSLTRIVFSGRSAVGVKNIWMHVEFDKTAQGHRVTSKIAKAHTMAWFYLFGVPIGPSRVRGINTYVTLTGIWRKNLGSLGARDTSAPS